MAKKRKMGGMGGIGEADGGSRIVSSFYNFPISNNEISALQLRSPQPLPSRDIIANNDREAVSIVEFSDDGSFFVSGEDHGRVLLWPTCKAMDDRREPVKDEMDTTDLNGVGLLCLSMSPDNERIISGFSNRKFLIHDTKT